jgi:putative restriction endonuclease
MRQDDPLPAQLAAFDTLRIWQQGAQRAPHKPLLVLAALGRWARGDRAPVAFEELDPILAELLRQFGPTRQSYHPEYPFWHLQSDGVWTVTSDDRLRMRVGSNSPPKSELIAHHARGGFSPEVARAFASDPRLVAEIAGRLLDAHFPSSIHDELRSAVGLDLGDAAGDSTGGEAESADGDRITRTVRPRDPTFRRRILHAYEDRCAVCDLDLRLGGATIGLDAAHIRWHQAGGPDAETNGLALCTLHHKTFDLGAFTIERGGNREGNTLLVSDQVRGGEQRLAEVLLRHHERPVRAPQHAEHAPDSEHLDWHRREVFKGRPRSVS